MRNEPPIGDPLCERAIACVYHTGVHRLAFLLGLSPRASTTPKGHRQRRACHHH